MREIKHDNNYISIFPNIYEFVDYITTKPRKSGRDHQSDMVGEDSFYGTRTFDEALKLLVHGDDDLFDIFSKESLKVDISKSLGNALNRKVYENDISGFIPNVPAYLKGCPVNMINVRTNGISHKVINIFLNIRVCGGVDAKEVIRIGTKYLTVIDALEKKGYRCNLYSGCANERNGHYSCLLVRVKTDKEPLNIKKICFTIANPSMQRRMKFRWMEVNDDSFDWTRLGYGGPTTIKYTEEMLNSMLKDNFLVWSYEDNNSSKSVEDIIKGLEKFGIKVYE